MILKQMMANPTNILGGYLLLQRTMRGGYDSFTKRRVRLFRKENGEAQQTPINLPRSIV